MCGGKVRESTHLLSPTLYCLPLVFLLPTSTRTYFRYGRCHVLYLPTNQGHFALGADAYCHFTSPIRRYPDVIVHRTLKRLLRGQTAPRAELSALPDICSTCSEQERKADAAARATQKIKLAEYYHVRKL